MSAGKRQRFWSSEDDGEWVDVAERGELDADLVTRLLAADGGADWGALEHAYGAAADVPVLLRALAIGDDRSRGAAWWELWGNVHH